MLFPMQNYIDGVCSYLAKTKQKEPSFNILPIALLKWVMMWLHILRVRNMLKMGVGMNEAAGMPWQVLAAVSS